MPLGLLPREKVGRGFCAWKTWGGGAPPPPTTGVSVQAGGCHGSAKPAAGSPPSPLCPSASPHPPLSPRVCVAGAGGAGHRGSSGEQGLEPQLGRAPRPCCPRSPPAAVPAGAGPGFGFGFGFGQSRAQVPEPAPLPGPGAGAGSGGARWERRTGKGRCAAGMQPPLQPAEPPEPAELAGEARGGGAACACALAAPGPRGGGEALRVRAAVGAWRATWASAGHSRPRAHVGWDSRTSPSVVCDFAGRGLTTLCLSFPF